MGYELLAQSRSPALRIDVPVCLLIVAEILGNLSAGRWPTSVFRQWSAHWSGERSQQLPKALHGWLPLVLHYLQP